MMPKLLQTCPLWRALDGDTSEDWFQLLECLLFPLTSHYLLGTVVSTRTPSSWLPRCTSESSATLLSGRPVDRLAHLESIFYPKMGQYDEFREADGKIFPKIWGSCSPRVFEGIISLRPSETGHVVIIPRFAEALCYLWICPRISIHDNRGEICITLACIVAAQNME